MILEEIAEEFEQAKNKGLVSSIFITPARALNIGLPKTTNVQSVDRLLEYVRGRWPNTRYETFRDEMEDCIAIVIREMPSDAEKQLADILSGEILKEINREVVRTIYDNAKVLEEKQKAIDANKEELYRDLYRYEYKGDWTVDWLGKEEKPKKITMSKELREKLAKRKKGKKNDSRSIASKRGSRNRVKGRKNLRGNK